MSLGVSLRPACIRPSLVKNGYPAFINFKYYPPHQLKASTCVSIWLIFACTDLSKTAQEW
jgi:hypothetical protein